MVGSKRIKPDPGMTKVLYKGIFIRNNLNDIPNGCLKNYDSTL